ncbi:PTS sugar transporter subunit IIC [bacterium]|nr:PTS sugar transporter subunit IIC [bacterium]
MWLDLPLFFWLTAKVSLFGALCALDRTALLQMMFSRPLVAATCGGALAGNWELGLLIGVLLELYFLSEIPVGTIIPTDDTLLALAAGGTGAALSGLEQNGAHAPGTLALLVLMTTLPWAAFTRKVDSWVRVKNGQLIDAVETSLLVEHHRIAQGSPAINLHLRGLLNFYGAAVFALFVMMTSSLLLVPLLLFLLPDWLRPFTDRLLFLLPLVGIVGLLSKMNQKRQLAVFAGVSTTLLLFL